MQARQILCLPDFYCFSTSVYFLQVNIAPSSGCVLDGAPVSSIKAQCDGSSLGNPGPTRGGVVLRDCYGVAVVAGSYFLGFGSNIFTELRALEKGLQLYDGLGLSEVLIESDSLQLVHMLLGESVWLSQHYKPCLLFSNTGVGI